MVAVLSQLEELEKEVHNVSLIFAEIFKDEINANDENKLYNGVKRVVRKFSDDKNAASAIDEFTRVISGGASLREILQIAKDEALNPSTTSIITVEGIGPAEQHNGRQ